MLIKAKKGQVSYGETIGILLLDTFVPFIPGDVGNATTYSFPVRFETMKGFTFTKLLEKDPAMLLPIMEAGHKLTREGVKVITADCGYMAMYQEEIKNELQIPVFLSSLLQIPFISSMVQKDDKIGIICSDARHFDEKLVENMKINTKQLYVIGMEGKENFRAAVLEERGALDPELIEGEVVSLAEKMVKDEPKIKAILLECSVLPPYAKAIQDAVNKPVFDYITMINYVHSALFHRRYTGSMY